MKLGEKVKEKKENNKVELNFSWFTTIIVVLFFVFVTIVFIYLYLKYGINLLEIFLN